MSRHSLALPAYLPSRFVGERFANHETGKLCFVTAEEINALVAEEIMTVKASRDARWPSESAIADSNAEIMRSQGKHVTEAQKAKRSEPSKEKVEIARDMQSVLKDIMTKIAEIDPRTGKATPELETQRVRASEDAGSDHESELNYELEATNIVYGDGKPWPKADDDPSDDSDAASTDDDSSSEDSDSSSEESEKRVRASRNAPKRKQTKKRKPVNKRSKSGQSGASALRRVDQQQRAKGAQFSARDVATVLKQSAARVLRPIEAPDPDLSFVHTTIEIPWNRREVQMIEMIYYRVPMVVACINTLKGQVLSEGIKFMRENVELVPSREFENYSIRHFQTFAAQALDALWMYGVIPICYEIDPITGQRWPYVPAVGTFILKRHTIRGAVRYRFYWTTQQTYSGGWRREQINDVRDAAGWRWEGRDTSACYNPGVGDRSGGVYDPTVEIIHNLGYEMLSTGSLASKMATLVGTAYSRMRSQKARITAEANSAAPPLMTEFDHNAEKQQSTNFKQGFFTSASGQQPEGTDIASITYQRDAASKEAFAGLMQHYESMTGIDAGDHFGVLHEEYRTDEGGTAVVKPNERTADGVTAPWASQYHLSSARKFANGPVAHSSTDYVAFMEFLEDEVCGVMGVPRTYINGTSIKTGGELVMNRFSDEVTRLKKLISDVLTHTYRVLFLGEDVTEYMASEFRLTRQAALLGGRGIGTSGVSAGSNAQSGEAAFEETRVSRAPTNGTRGALLTEEDLYETDAIKRVHVTFAKKASESVEELQQLFAFGGIDQKTMCAELARRNNFDPLSLRDEAEEEEIPLDMKRMLVPQFGEYIKLEFQERMAKEQLKAQEKQAKAQNQMQEKEIKVKEKSVKEKSKVDTHKADKQAETAKHNAKAAEAKTATAEVEAKSGGGESGGGGSSKKSSKKSKKSGSSGGSKGDTIKVQSYVRRRHASDKD